MFGESYVLYALANSDSVLLYIVPPSQQRATIIIYATSCRFAFFAHQLLLQKIVFLQHKITEEQIRTGNVACVMFVFAPRFLDWTRCALFSVQSIRCCWSWRRAWMQSSIWHWISRLFASRSCIIIILLNIYLLYYNNNYYYIFIYLNL